MSKKLLHPYASFVISPLFSMYFTSSIPRFANVVVWMDAVIFRIDCGYKRAAILKDYIGILKRTRDVLEKRNPYNKCEKYQQEILGDMEKLKTPDNEILVRNVINRTEEEFLRLSIENKKNNKLNMISIAIGIMGIAVSATTFLSPQRKVSTFCGGSHLSYAIPCTFFHYHP